MSDGADNHKESHVSALPEGTEIVEGEEYHDRLTAKSTVWTGLRGGRKRVFLCNHHGTKLAGKEPKAKEILESNVLRGSVRSCGCLKHVTRPAAKPTPPPAPANQLGDADEMLRQYAATAATEIKRLNLRRAEIEAELKAATEKAEAELKGVAEQVAALTAKLTRVTSVLATPAATAPARPVGLFDPSAVAGVAS